MPGANAPGFVVLLATPPQRPEVSRGLLIQLLEAFPTEVGIENLISGLGSLWMGPAALARRWRRIPPCGAAQVLGHQSKGTTSDGRKAHQLNHGQKVIHWQLLFSEL